MQGESKSAMVHVIMGQDDTMLEYDMEARFGAYAFDTHFKHVQAKEIYQALKEYAEDENDVLLKSFLVAVDDFEDIPCRLFYIRMFDLVKKLI